VLALERHARHRTAHASLIAEIGNLLIGNTPAPAAGAQRLLEPLSDSALDRASRLCSAGGHRRVLQHSPRGRPARPRRAWPGFAAAEAIGLPTLIATPAAFRVTRARPPRVEPLAAPAG
jgi:predicted TIM-barrel fold metal-dependent hydrolase